MLVKVSKGSGGWLLLNDVRCIDYPSVSRTAKSQEDLQHQLGEIEKKANGSSVKVAITDPSVTFGDGSRSSPYKFNSLEVEHLDGRLTVVVFDHPVYLCDSTGNTVDTVRLR